MENFYNIFIKIFLGLVCLYCLSCSSNNINTPENIGKYTFNLLKEFDDISKQAFIDRFLSLQQIQHHVNSNEDIIDEYFRDKFCNKEMNIKEWRNHFLNVHYWLKSEAKKHGINWLEINYIDFHHETEEVEGFITSYGVLLFSHNNTNYSIKTTAFKDQQGFKLVDLCSFEAVE